MFRLAVHVCATSLFAVSLQACGSAAIGAAALDTTQVDEAALTATLPAFRICDATPFVPNGAKGFDNPQNRMFEGMDPYHHTQDIITTPHSRVHAAGLFTYGWTRSALVGETVDFSTHDCATWQAQASASTDQFGIAAVDFKVGEPGRYRMTELVAGDATGVSARVTVVPAGTHAVIFDIDGTLTVDDTEMAKALLNPDYSPESFPGSVTATRAWAAKGYQIIYVTGRNINLSAMTRAWMNAKGFAPGTLHFSEDLAALNSTDAGVGEYKRKFFQGLLDKGLVVDYAYGNATTDTYAYMAIGLKADQIYMLGKNAGYRGTHALPRGYTEHLPFIAAQPAVVQPYAL